MAITTIPIGLADIAAFKSHCPAAAAFVATFCAIVAAVLAPFAIASFAYRAFR